ncbi:MAG: hypothetical protein LUI12_04710 [Clostridiales bacterium]|nr:hypothetical protein [Clostridiales bacterium]
MRRGKGILILLTAVLGLAGCGQAKTPEVSSVSIEKDGTVTHQIVGQFEQNYYETDGLTALAEERVEEYCADYGEGCVILESVEKEESTVQVTLKYAAPEDYAGFNHRELYLGTLEEAQEQGYTLEKVAFVSAKGEPMELGYIEEPESKKIIIIATKPGEELLVTAYGKVLYINQSADSDIDVSFEDKKSVRIDNPVQEDSNGAQAALSYIIFE